MATYTWIGGGNNEASNPADWSPTGVPILGSQLEVLGSQTMNIVGDVLAGDNLRIVSNDFVGNLSHHAVLSAVEVNSNAIFNLSGGSELDLTVATGVLIEADATINMSGKDTLNIIGSGTINLAHGAKWSGTFDGAVFSVNGSAGAAFHNTGTSEIGPPPASFTSWPPGGSTSVINADVVGRGVISVAASISGPSQSREDRLVFMQSVGKNQSILNAGIVQIDEPADFAASITLVPLTASYDGSTLISSQIDLVGLANADSYTFKNDVLNIYSGRKVIDTLRLADQTQYGFEVEKTSVGVSVLAYTDASRTTVGTALPGASEPRAHCA